MSRKPSPETELRHARAEIKRLATALHVAQHAVEAWKANALRFQNEAEDWRKRFDMLLAMWKEKPK